MNKVIKSKRLLTSEELEEYLRLDTPLKQKKYLEKLYDQLFELYEPIKK